MTKNEILDILIAMNPTNLVLLALVCERYK